MSIKIDWPAMSSVPDSLTLYWSSTPFTLDTLPADKFVLSPSAVTYTDTSVPNRTYRYYMLEAKKIGANPQYSQCMIHGSWDKTGPGPQTIRRGNWKTGYFGFVPSAEFFTVSGLVNAVGATSLPYIVADSVVTGWYKFVVDGKILFIPSAAFNVTKFAWGKLYNLGLVYGVDGPGEAPFDLTTVTSNGYAIPAPVNQKKVVTVGTDNFLVRLPKISSLPVNQYLPLAEPDRASVKNSEWWQTIPNMVTLDSNGVADAPFLPANKWSDLPTGATYAPMGTQHFVSGKANAVVWAGYTSYRGDDIDRVNYEVRWVPVLEYIPE